MTFLGTLVLAAGPASACGGFACDNVTAPPVLQAAERVVFGLDPATDEVEMHVQISYTGTHEFAWIVPVPQVPELMLSTSALFSQLALTTQPTFTLVNRDEGTCREESVKGGSTYSDAAMSVDSTGGGYSSSEGDFYDVTVAGSETVGPYETVTLRGASADDVLGWLRSEGYALPSNMSALLDPYVSADAWFVALKLKTGAVVGDLAPLAMKYTADKASIPVQLTSMAATPDMRMEVYVFSDGRAVPESYLHVQINDAAINWWKSGRNYERVITVAADEAGGHAFATDYHGTTLVIPPFHGGDWPTDELRATTDPDRWLAALRPSFSPLTPPELFTALEEIFVLPAGQGQVLWSCPSCVELDGAGFDPDLATDLMVEQVFEPLDAAQRLLDRHHYLSRMTSSLDAVEMTVDPVFVVNHDLAQPTIPFARTAGYAWECDGKQRTASNRRLELADGRQIEIPSQDWLADEGMTEFQWIRELGEIKAQIIEQQGAEGPPEILVDHTSDLFDLVDAHNDLLAGCGGCSTSGGGSVAGVALLVGLLRRRVRSSTTRS